MSRPSTLTVNGATTGVVFVDGVRVADAIPAREIEVLPGRHNVQALLRDGHELTAPAPTLLREGSSIILFVRPMNRDGRPLEDLDRIELLEGGVRTAEDDAALEGSAAFPAPTPWPGRWSGSDQAAAEGSAPAANEGSAAPAGEGSAPAADALAAAPAEGSAPATADAASDGSGAVPSGETVWAELIINSQPVGSIFIDGMRTPWYTPARIRLPERRYSVQIQYDDGSLSRHLEPPITHEATRQVDFTGTDLLVIR